MGLLLLFALLAGAATALSPVVLASALGRGRWRPLGVVAGLVASFAVLTLTVAALVSLLGVPPDALRLAAALVVGAFGLVLAVPRLERAFDLLVGRLGRPGGAPV